MNYIIVKGENIVEAAHNLADAEIAARTYLPINFTKGDDLRPSLCVAIYKEVKHYGDKAD